MRARLRALLLVAVTLLVLALLTGWLRSLMHDAPATKRQVARIAVLPDTPPPPPPPKPRPDETPRPQKAAQPTPQAPKAPAPQPAPAPLKMEGAAGNGPSAFAAGAVTQDYRGGTPTIGGNGASQPGGDASRRAQERLYANTVRQLLHDELQRQLSPDAGELSAAFALWVEASGRIRRWELEPAADALEPQREAALKLALDRSAGQLLLPAPPDVPQPMRFRLTVRAGG